MSKIIAADYSNIEGRVLAWLAGEHWKVEAFRAFDRGDGPDIYKATAAGILGKSPYDVTKLERQGQGKVPELACGYQGSVGAFQAMAVGYGYEVTDERAKSIVDAWRAKHPRTKDLWYEMESSAFEAFGNPGVTVHAANGRIAFKKVGSWLFMRLPSGRALVYPYPHTAWKKMPWTDYEGEPVYKECLAYKGVDSRTRKWGQIFTYGGSLVENAVQAIARDIMADAMPRLEAAGYPIILTVHDEVVAEVPDGHGSVEEFTRIMTDLPAWADGCPISADGWIDERYHK